MIKSTYLTAALNIRIPMVPNYLFVPATSKETERSFPIQDFDDSQLKQIGEVWTKNLIETAQQRRSAPQS